jgi:hypothetical protein
LCCLWFEVPRWLADRHQQELTDFAAEIGTDAAYFSALTYQELFARMWLSSGETTRNTLRMSGTAT